MEMVGELIVFYDYTLKFAVLFWVTFYDLALDSRIINHSRMLSRLFYFFKSAVKKKNVLNLISSSFYKLVVR